MTVNLAVDYVVYPAVVGAIGLVVAGMVKVLKGVNWDKVPSWPLLLVAGAVAIGFAVGDMPDSPNSAVRSTPNAQIQGSSDSDNAKRVEVVKLHYDYLDKHPPASHEHGQQRLLPAAADGAILAGGMGLCAVGLLLAVSSLVRYVNSD